MLNYPPTLNSLMKWRPPNVDLILSIICGFIYTQYWENRIGTSIPKQESRVITLMITYSYT